MKLVILPEGADLDALSSAFGVLKLYPDAYLVRPKQLSKTASAVFKDFKHIFRLVENPPAEVETLILVDNCSLEKVGKVPRYRKLLIYDHHEEGCRCENCTLVVDRVGSATTLVVEELIKRRLEVSPLEATLLALGIYEDTGRFAHVGTTPRDLLAAAWLLQRGADLNLINRYLEEKISQKELEVVQNLLKSVEYVTTPEGWRVAVATFRGETYTPDFQDLVHRLKELTENTDGYFVIYEAGNKTYLFGRAINPSFDTAQILKKLGGGGHSYASSLKVEGIPAERVKKRLTEVLEGKLPNIFLENFISRPPLVVYEDETLEKALKKLTDFGFAGAPVVDREKKPLGVIYKKELLRAIKHLGTTKVRVSEVYNPDVVVLKTKDTIWDAEKVLSRFGQKLIPVVNERGKIEGVLTRLDIFRNIIAETPSEEKATKVRLSPEVEEFAKKVGEIAQKLGLKGYLVGGVVRDILLGKPVWDLDITVEGGNAVDLAKEVAQFYGVKLHPFEKFKTAHLKVGRLKVEFATARREKYEKSGAYPEIQPSCLKEDLFRRDFTINAMAVALNPDNFGSLIDYVGGLEDLKKGIIRVLHSLSFVEDPIRILRALRFAGRLGFKLSKGTKTLLRQAVSLGVLKNAPRSRIANELRLAFREDNFLEILKLYKDYRVLEQILPSEFQWSMVNPERLKKLKELLKEFKDEIRYPGWILFVSILLELKKETALSVLKELSAPSRVGESYLQAKEEGGKILKTLLGAKKPSELLKGLQNYHPESLLMVASRGGEKAVDLVRFYLKELKPFKVKVDVEKFKRKGLKDRELGLAIEREREKLIDEIFGKKFNQVALKPL
ncbi:MAG TPA: CBS domain-containing protein [Aquifex aeolicus]|nr:CBS domain-containing protein [Aquifex aeolicus]